MHGAFYLVSSNIAQWVAAGGDSTVHLPMSLERTWGNGEDVIFADWVARFFQVHPQLHPRIKNRASDQRAVFRHVSDLLTTDQKASLAKPLPTSHVQDDRSGYAKAPLIRESLTRLCLTVYKRLWLSHWPSQ